MENLIDHKRTTHLDETLAFRFVKVVEGLHILIIELDDLQVIDDTLLSDRFRENDYFSLNCRGLESNEFRHCRSR